MFKMLYSNRLKVKITGTKKLFKDNNSCRCNVYHIMENTHSYKIKQPMRVKCPSRCMASGAFCLGVIVSHWILPNTCTNLIQNRLHVLSISRIGLFVALSSIFVKLYNL